MLKKIILAGATAGVIAVSSLAAMTTTASAAPYNGNAWHNHQQQDCRKVVRNVKWFDRHGHPHWRRVVSLKCGFMGPNPHPHWH